MKIITTILVITFSFAIITSCEKENYTQRPDLTLTIKSFEYNLFELGMEIEILDLNYPNSTTIDTVTVYTKCAYRKQETDDWEFVTFVSPITPQPSINIIDTVIDFSDKHIMTKNFSFTQEGQYKFIFSIDPDNKINEIDETNNTKSTGIGQIK